MTIYGQLLKTGNVSGLLQCIHCECYVLCACVQVIDAVAAGVGVYYNSSGQAKCLNISQSATSKLGSAGWAYQVLACVLISKQPLNITPTYSHNNLYVVSVCLHVVYCYSPWTGVHRDGDAHVLQWCN